MKDHGKYTVVLFDDDPDERSRISSLLGGRFELACYSNLFSFDSEEKILKIFHDLGVDKVRAVIVDLKDDRNHESSAQLHSRPGERIARIIDEKLLGRQFPVIILSVLVDERGELTEQPLEHLKDRYAATLSKSDGGRKKLKEILSEL